MNTLNAAADWLLSRLNWAPDWTVSLILFALALLAAEAVRLIVNRILRRFVADRDLFWRSIVSRTELLVQFTLVLVALTLASLVSPLSATGKALAGQAFVILIIVLAGLAIHSVFHIWMIVYLRRFKLDAEDNLLARKHVTQMRILRRILDIVIIVVVISAVLMTFDGVRQYGISLLASAGAAGIVAALALQPLLKNLFAGIQLAITQPIRIDDALLVEGEWGNVEEITATYVVVRIWDLRRLILPLSYFIEQPFQNWTRDQARLIGAVILYLDFGAPVDLIRAKVNELVEASDLWDRRVVVVQVTDATERTMVVRILASAKNSPAAWDLRCYLREEVIAFLRKEHPEALPRTRAILDEGGEIAMGRAASSFDKKG